MVEEEVVWMELRWWGGYGLLLFGFTFEPSFGCIWLMKDSHAKDTLAVCFIVSWADRESEDLYLFSLMGVRVFKVRSGSRCDNNTSGDINSTEKTLNNRRVGGKNRCF